MTIAANLVIGSNGGTTINGRSAPLSSPADRKRFHELRERADVIIIGGQTARSEPYSKTPLPLIVVTRSPELPGSAAKNPTAIMSSDDIATTLKRAMQSYPNLLIEGGAHFLHAALASTLIDELYITATQMSAEEPFVDQTTLTQGFRLVSEVTIDGDLFLHYARLPNK